MSTKSPADIQGFEYDWLATDGDGHVALFSTAGGGYAPDAFLRDTDSHDAAIDAILASEPRSGVRFAPVLPPGRKNTWRLAAERGIFAFDSDPNGGPYRLVAAPDVPVRVRDLAEGVAAVVMDVRFAGLRFAELRVLPATMLRR